MELKTMEVINLSNQMDTNKFDIAQKLAQIGRRIVIATHPRSGTHLTIDLLRKQFRECQAWLWYGETLHHSYLNLDHLSSQRKPHINFNQAINILNRASRPLIKTHCLPEFKELGYNNEKFINQLMQNADIYYVVRDGRSVMCSVHLWMQKYHPQTRCSFSEFIRQEINGMSRPKYWSYHIHQWLQQDNVKLLKFEENIKNTRYVVSRIADDLELKPLYIEPLLPNKILSDNRWQHYLARLCRKLESTTIGGRYQSKKPKKWTENFNQQDRIFFNNEAGEILYRLGYETSDSWLK